MKLEDKKLFKLKISPLLNLFHCIWANSKRQWGIGKPSMLQSTGVQSQTQLSDWTTKTCVCVCVCVYSFSNWFVFLDLNILAANNTILFLNYEKNAHMCLCSRETIESL